MIEITKSQLENSSPENKLEYLNMILKGKLRIIDDTNYRNLNDLFPGVNAK